MLGSGSNPLLNAAFWVVFPSSYQHSSLAFVVLPFLIAIFVLLNANLLFLLSLSPHCQSPHCRSDLHLSAPMALVLQGPSPAPCTSRIPRIHNRNRTAKSLLFQQVAGRRLWPFEYWIAMMKLPTAFLIGHNPCFFASLPQFGHQVGCAGSSACGSLWGKMIPFPLLPFLSSHLPCDCGKIPEQGQFFKGVLELLFE